MWIPVEAPLVCGADRRGSTARRTHEEEKVEPVRSTTSSTSTRATSREFLRLLSVFFRCAARRVVTIYDLILAWFLVYAIENFDLCYRSLRVSQQRPRVDAVQCRSAPSVSLSLSAVTVLDGGDAQGVVQAKEAAMWSQVDVS